MSCRATAVGHLNGNELVHRVSGRDATLGYKSCFQISRICSRAPAVYAKGPVLALLASLLTHQKK